MKLILRKKDGTTSILLFIFNNYINKYNEDYIEIGKVLELMKGFNKNETATRMALSRAVKNGVLLNKKNNNNTVYEITPQGKEFLNAWNRSSEGFWKRYKYRNIKWNNKWYCISIEQSKKDGDSKTKIINEISEIGMINYNTGMWISPFYKKEEMDKILEKYNLLEDSVQFYGELIIHNNINEFIQKNYNTEVLKEKYLKFITKYNNEYLQLQKLKEKYFSYDGQCLYILYELGYDFYEIASNDKILPKELLKEYEGDQAIHLMKDFRNLLLKYVYEYFKNLQ